MKSSILFLGVFTAGLLTGMEVHWHSFLWGLTFGVSIFQIAWPFVKKLLDQER